MTIEITYTNLDFPFGKKFSTEGLGVLFNGEPKVLTAEEEAQYRAITGNTVHQGFDKREDFTVRTINSNDQKAGGVNY